VLHALFISSSLTWSFQLYLANSTSYEAPDYAVFSNLISLHPFSVQIFSSAPYSQTPSVCVPLLMSETQFHTPTNHGKNYTFVDSSFYVFRQQTRRQDSRLNGSKHYPNSVCS
jgi:hypothetical protein